MQDVSRTLVKSVKVNSLLSKLQERKINQRKAIENNRDLSLINLKKSSNIMQKKEQGPQKNPLIDKIPTERIKSKKFR